MEWFYENNGEQQGPVTEAVLKELHVSGQILGRTLVWSKGMSDWAPFSEVFPEGTSARSTPAVPPVQAGPLSAHDNPLPSAAELRGVARERLAGNWGIGALVVFLNQFLQQVAASIIPGLGVIVSWVIAGPLALGLHGYFLGLVRRESVEVSTLFDGFSQFGRALLLFIFIGLIIGLSALASAIPGGIMMAIASQREGFTEADPLFLSGIVLVAVLVTHVCYYLWLRYSMVYFIALDEPEMKPLDVLNASAKMMDGHKWRLLWLTASYIGWFILGFCAFIIGLFWSTAYMSAGIAAFYEDLRKRT